MYIVIVTYYKQILINQKTSKLLYNNSRMSHESLHVTSIPLILTLQAYARTEIKLN